MTALPRWSPDKREDYLEFARAKAEQRAAEARAKARREEEARAYSKGVYTHKVRSIERRRIAWRVRSRDELSEAWQDFLRSDAGHPLSEVGVTGRPLREDGETHIEADIGLIRRDPCAYCGGPGGTVDHIEPKSQWTPTTHTWFNYTGACAACNSSKSDTNLLDFLWKRKR